MKTTRVLPACLAVLLLAPLAPAQTAIWQGQTPPDPNRLSDWTVGSNWSTGSAPNGATAFAQLVDGNYVPGGLPLLDGLQINLTTVTLNGLQYVRVASGYTNYTSYFPSITIGGANPGDSGQLDLTGTGITSPTSLGNSYQVPALNLRNGRLTLANSARVDIPVNVYATNGVNQVWLRDDSVASNVNVALGSNSRLDATDRARLQNGTVNFSGGAVAFSGQSTFANSTLAINGPGLVDFSGQASVISPYIYFSRPWPANDSIVRFSGNTQVQGGSAFSYYDTGAIEFTEQANTNGSFAINGVRLLDVTGASTGTGTTGRQRATTGTLAATSVVADDARIINLGYVTVEDLMLGSNSVRVSGGSLRYISDTGGAYVSAGGANLTGGGVIVANYNYYNPLTLLPNVAPSPYAVPLTIETGSVNTYRPQLGAVTVQPTGVLTLRAGSSGSILNSGIVALSATNYSVAGNFTQTGTGMLTFSVPPSGVNAPRLDVSGQAALAGTLQIYSSGTFVGSRRYPILRAGSITGTFSSTPTINLSPMLTVGVEYTGNEVIFAYTQRPFVNAGSTASQKALGAHLDATLTTTAGAHYNLLYALNTFQDSALIAAGLGQLAPDRYGVLNEQGFAAAAARQAAIDRRLATLRTAPAATNGFGVFVEGGQLQDKFAAVEGLPGVTLKSSGGLAGATWQQGRCAAGLTVAKDRTSGALDIYGSSARIKSTTPGLFAQYDAGRFFVQAAASRSADDYTLVRNSGLVYRSSMSSATVAGSRTDLALTAGTTFQRKDWSLTPYVGILSSQVKLDDFTESHAGGLYAYELGFNDWSVRSLRTRAGFDLAGPIAGKRVVPRLSVAWLHELKKDRGITAGLVSAGGARYLAPGRPAETDLVQAAVGVDWRLARKLDFSVNAGFARGKNSDTTSDLSAGFRWEF